MRHADFATAPLLPTAPTAPTRPASAIGGGAGFARVFAEVQGEVADFIAHGGGSFAATPALTPEAQVARARAESALAAAGEAEPAP
ncbi:MAG TPA: flagellar assembly peptidoglycan hydrolase FlgJ, partial [Telluria sp.]|nr:flagellar assembly peptidoglycan hydrolase FlgJ [Telluria sp.]